MRLPGRGGGGRAVRSVRVIACIVAQPLEQPAGVGFSRQTLPGDFKLLVALKRNGGMRILGGSSYLSANTGTTVLSART